jgi:chemotaxis-related protein WspB
MLFLLFQLGADRYALPAGEVTEVLPLVALKSLPGAPLGVAGLIDYRGTAVPVVDLSALTLGRPAAQRVSTRVLMVKYPLARDETRLLGLIAEKATETMARQPEDFKPTGVTSESTRYLGPVAHDPRGLIQRIEIDALLTPALRAALFPVETEVRR